MMSRVNEMQVSVKIECDVLRDIKIALVKALIQVEDNEGIRESLEDMANYYEVGEKTEVE